MQDKRFVIQEHSACGGPEGVHWDLMLESASGGSLTTFRLPAGASDRSVVLAERIFDHPLRFLWYEGPVQNGTGRVRIVDRGTWSAADTTQASASGGPEADAIHLVFDGAVLHGAFALTRISETEWRLHREPPLAGSR
jgi:hypothetical protein